MCSKVLLFTLLTFLTLFLVFKRDELPQIMDNIFGVEMTSGTVNVSSVVITPLLMVSTGKKVESFELQPNDITYEIAEFFMFPNGTEDTSRVNKAKNNVLLLQNTVETAQMKISLFSKKLKLTQAFTKIVVYFHTLNLTPNQQTTVSLAPQILYPSIDYLVGKIGDNSPARVNVTFTTDFKTNSKLPTFKEFPTDVDVVVVGAGYSGIQTASHLLNQGVNVVLLEGNPIVGGRNKPFTFNISGKPVTFDVGAEYIGHSQNEIWLSINEIYKNEFADKLVDVVETMAGGKDEAHLLNFSNPIFVEDVFQKEYTYRYDENVQIIPGIDGVPGNLELWKFIPMGLLLIRITLFANLISIKDTMLTKHQPPKLIKYYKETQQLLKYMDNNSTYNFTTFYGQRTINENAVYVIQDMLEISCQAPLSLSSDKFSALYFFLYSKQNGGFTQIVSDVDGPQEYFMKGSFHPYANKLAENLNNTGRLYTNMNVTSVRSVSKDKVQVILSSGKVINAKRVVLSMAPSSANLINFDSNIRNKYDKLFKQKMGVTIKGFISYKTQWWNDPLNRNTSYSGYYGGMRNSDFYNQLYFNKTGKKNDLIFTWFFDNSIKKDGTYTLMYFIVGDNALNLVQSVGYNKSWSIEQLIAAINPIMKESAMYHLGYLFNKKFLKDQPQDQPDFRPEAFDPISHESGIWFQDTPFIPGGPDTVLAPGQNVYSLLEESPKDQIASNNGIIFSGTEFSHIYAGYMTGAMYQGRVAANDILSDFGIPQVPTTYLNYPFTVNVPDFENFTFPTLFEPTDLAYEAYLYWDEIDAIANEFKDKMYMKPDNDKNITHCLERMMLKAAEILLRLGCEFDIINKDPDRNQVCQSYIQFEGLLAKVLMGIKDPKSGTLKAVQKVFNIFKRLTRRLNKF